MLRLKKINLRAEYSAFAGKSFERVAVLTYLFPAWPTGGQAKVAFRRETIEINSCKLSYARGGAGEPLIYLHGFELPRVAAE